MYELHVRPGLDDLASDLVPENQVLWRGGVAAYHVLVTAADIGRQYLEDRAVRALAAGVGRINPWPVAKFEGRVVNGVHLDGTRFHICDGSVATHMDSPHIPAY